MNKIQGPYGTGYRFDIDFMFSQIGKRDNTLAMYAVHVPWANCMWEWFFIQHQNLIQIEGLPKLKFTRPGSTHEMVIFALDPKYRFDARKNPARYLLHPTNFCAQYTRASDAAAIDEIEQCVRDIVNGDISPDTDYTQHWIARFSDSNIKGDPKTAGQTIVDLGEKGRLTFDPKPLDVRPKDVLCKHCGMPAVAVAIVGDDICLRCSTTRADVDIKKSMIWKMLKQ